MDSSSNPEVRVPIGVPVETNAAAAADSVDALRDSISASTDVIRDAVANMRNLRGKTDAVKAAKDQLRATIEKERAAVTDATLKLVKQGTTYDRLALQAKKAAEAAKKHAQEQDKAKKKAEAAAKTARADQAKAFADAIARAGGPVASLSEKLKFLTEIGAKGGNLAVVGLAAAGATVAVIALTAAAVAGVAALGRWALRGADAARSLGLVREASVGTSLNARNLGTQVDALADRVPTATAALNELAASIGRSRLGGQATVDTLNAVAQASAAIDDTTGNKIREIIERGRLANRMYLGLLELQGTGLEFDDVATALSRSMRVGVKEARSALLEGRVKLGDGAKAMRAAVEAKFGDVNLRKMMSLDGLSETLSKKFGKLTNEIDFDRGARSLYKLLSALDETTATGAALKRMTTVFGNGLVSAIERGTPIAHAFFRQMIVGGLEAYISYLTFKREVTRTIDLIKKPLEATGLLDSLDKLSSRFDVVRGAAGVALMPLHEFRLVMTVVTGELHAFNVALGAIERAYHAIANLSWKTLGIEIVRGLVEGLTVGMTVGKLRETVGKLANVIKRGFKDDMEIRSPSRAMKREAKQVPAGVKGGIEEGTPGVQRAVDNMIAPPRLRASLGAVAGGGGDGGARRLTLEAHLHLHGGSGTASQQMQEPALLEQFSKLLRDAAGQAGLLPEGA